MTEADAEILEQLSAFINEPPPETPPAETSDDGWNPDLNPTQRLIFDDPTDYIFGDGERGSGKSMGFLFKLVRHCYEVPNALAYIIVTNYNVGDFGAWHQLEHMVLPAWKEGNRHGEWIIDDKGQHQPNPLYNQLKDHGIGLEYTPTKLDAKTKASKIFIGNRHGGWSLVVLLSIPHGAFMEARMKGPAPSFIYIEELTNCDSRHYFAYPTMQLGRRVGLQSTPQQYCASMNPAGPSHWAYKLIFEECVAAQDKPGREWPDGIRRKPQFARYHVPFHENRHRLPPGYIERIEDACYNNPVLAARYRDGLWVDMPSGQALFAGHFVPNVHVRGDIRKNLGIIPLKGFSIIMGYDPGPVNFSVSFLQMIPTKEKIVWTIFDEINLVGKYVPYWRVVAIIMRRMLHWNTTLSASFHFVHISDEAAFNQLRGDGTYDNLAIQKLSQEWCQQHAEAGLKPIVLKPCPKGEDSVPSRYRLMCELFGQEQLLVSAMCIGHLAMFNNVEREDVKEGKYDAMAAFRPKNSMYRHPADSCSYPIFYYSGVGFKNAVQTGSAPAKVYEAK